MFVEFTRAVESEFTSIKAIESPSILTTKENVSVCGKIYACIRLRIRHLKMSIKLFIAAQQ